jgi:hypothetical protein
MTKYEVTVQLSSLVYIFEAENEDEALDRAEGYVSNESYYDLLKWADYDVKEVKA